MLGKDDYTGEDVEGCFLALSFFLLVAGPNKTKSDGEEPLLKIRWNLSGEKDDIRSSLVPQLLGNTKCNLPTRV